jgi:hypothetical protein
MIMTSRFKLRNPIVFFTNAQDIVCRYLAYYSPFSVAAEAVQKMGRQASPFKIFQCSK